MNPITTSFSILGKQKNSGYRVRVEGLGELVQLLWPDWKPRTDVLEANQRIDSIFGITCLSMLMSDAQQTLGFRFILSLAGMSKALINFNSTPRVILTYENIDEEPSGPPTAAFTGEDAKKVLEQWEASL